MEEHPRPPQPRRRGPHRDRQGRGDLLQRHLFQLEEDEHLAVRLRQAVEQRFELLASAPANQQLLGVGSRIARLCDHPVGEDLMGVAAAAPSVGGEVGDHADQEGQLATGRDPLQASGEDGKGLLGRLFRLAAVAAETVGGPPDASEVLPQQGADLTRRSVSRDGFR